MITRGDMVKAAKRSQSTKIWPQTDKELATFWEPINLYSDPTKHKKFSAVMVLPVADRLIDPDDVPNEIKIQNEAGNNVKLIERRLFGHIETIFIETTLFPKRVLGYIKMLE
jgi:hypothetical protein